MTKEEKPSVGVCSRALYEKLIKFDSVSLHVWWSSGVRNICICSYTYTYTAYTHTHAIAYTKMNADASKNLFAFRHWIYIWHRCFLRKRFGHCCASDWSTCSAYSLSVRWLFSSILKGMGGTLLSIAIYTSIPFLLSFCLTLFFGEINSYYTTQNGKACLCERHARLSWDKYVHQCYMQEDGQTTIDIYIQYYTIGVWLFSSASFFGSTESSS